MDVYVTRVSALIAGRMQTIHVTALTEGRELVLVDSGYPGQEKLIIAALQEEGLDMNHIGSATALRHPLPADGIRSSPLRTTTEPRHINVPKLVSSPRSGLKEETTSRP